MKTDLFVYYRVDANAAQALQDKVVAMQAQPGMRGSLHRRPETRDGLHTWMEVYRAVPAGFAERLAAAARDAGLDSLIVGERHHEIFLEVSPCA